MKASINQVSQKVNITINAVFIVLSLCCVFPFLLILSVSFSNEASINKYGYKMIPEQFSFNAYHFLFSDISQIARSYGITIFVTVVGTLISLLFVALYGYTLYRKDFPFRSFFAMFLFITMLFNGGLVPFYILYTNYLNLKDSLFALIMPYLMNPFYVIIMRTFFSSTIPDSVVESAKIDGANEFYILYKIVFPLSLPVFATIGLFSTLVYWNDWFMSLLFISDPKNISIQFHMYKVILDMQYLLNNTKISVNMSNADIPGETTRMAMAIVGIGPIVFAYPFFQRYFVKGLTVGAVKG